MTIINGEKIYTQMRDAMGKQISAAKFLAIFDEPMLDEKRFLLFGNKTLDELILLSIKGKGEIMNFKGIGEAAGHLRASQGCLYICLFQEPALDVGSHSLSGSAGFLSICAEDCPGLGRARNDRLSGRC